MVIGNGLLATTFKSYIKRDDIIIFASGVSNSSNTNETEFRREIQLLQSAIEQEIRLIYFSTISVYDQTLAKNAYIQHKLYVEEFLINNNINNLIFRLPILLGNTKNPHTLCNFIADKIKTQSKINIFTNACRYLIDVVDLSIILPHFIDNFDHTNSIIDVNYNNEIKILELVQLFESYFGIKTEHELINTGGCYTTNNKLFIRHANHILGDYKPDYIKNCIAKYY